MKPVQNKTAFLHNLSFRLIVWLLIAVTIVSGTFLLLLSESFQQRQLQLHHNAINDVVHAWQLSQSVNGKVGAISADKALIELLEKMEAVEKVEKNTSNGLPLDSKNIVRVPGANDGDGLLVYLNMSADKKYPAMQHNQVFVIIVTLTIVIILSVLYLRKYSAYLTKLTTFLKEIRSEEQVHIFAESSAVAEFDELRGAVNNTAEKVYMQSLAVRRVFDELNRFSMLLEYSPVLIVTLNTELDVTYLNRAFKNVLPEEYQDSEVLKHLPEDITELVSNCIVENQIIQGLESVADKRNYIWSIVPMPAQTEANCFGVDITQLRKAESETESAYVDSMMARDESEAKSIFLANMSHEIRTPLTAILGFSEALLDTAQPMEERVAGINTIIRNAKHLLSIINDLLDITKIESGLAVVNLQPTSLKSILEDVCNNYTAQARAKGIDFNLSVDNQVPEIIISDELRLRQILFNVCTNALKFTDQGNVSCHVNFDQQQNELKLIVKDTGIGMSRAEQAIIFNRFEQSDSSHSRKYGGSGLGLYISHELATRLGGSIAVDSAPGSGSKFTIIIKAEPETETRYLDKNFAVKAAVELIDNDRGLYSGHVLLVEDNFDNQNLVRMYLAKLGATVDVANNGLEAVEKASATEFDVILMDMQMPVMDGVEATKKIIASGSKTPVVMLTANAMNDDIEICHAAGCADVVIKPIQRSFFEKKVISYLHPSESAKQDLAPVISELVNEGPEFYNIVKAYVKQLPGDLENVKVAFNEDDNELLKSRVHSMKGTSGNMGFLEYSQICAKIEFAITKDDRDEISQLINSLEVMKQRIIAGIKE